MVARPFLVLKIGGSLFSDSAKHRHVHAAVIDKFALLVAKLAQAAAGRLALIIGGGSYGHGAVRDADPRDPFGLLGLTAANFRQKCIWTEALRTHGTPAIPLQLAAMCTLNNDRLIADGSVLRHVLKLGLLPVVSGDCLIGTDGRLHVFGSDRVPEVFMRCLPPPLRIVALTDTPGIVRDRIGSGVLAYVNPDVPDDAYTVLWNQKTHDTTGSMRGKLDALVQFAREGAECFIMKGDPDVPSLRFLLERIEDWPAETEHTRIAYQ